MKRFESKINFKFSAEDEVLFNSARLLVLFETLSKLGFSDGIDLERTGYYDFFSAQPFLVFNDDVEIKLELLYCGFESSTIGYISSSQRFTSRRQKNKHYLAALIMRDLISVRNLNGKFLYSITEKGKTAALNFKSLYVQAYRKSAEIIIKKFGKMSDTKLAINAREWLKAESFMIDLYDY